MNIPLSAALLATFGCALATYAAPITFRLAAEPIYNQSSQDAPEVTVDVAGAAVTWSSFVFSQDGQSYAFTGNVAFAGDSPDDRTLLSFSGQFDGFPFIAWTASASTGSVSKQVSFAFTQPLAPGAYTQLTSALSGSLGDVQGDGVAATGIAGISEAPAGSSIYPLGITGDCVAGKKKQASNYPCPIDGAQFGPRTANLMAPTYYPSMTASLAFKLTPNDSASFQGQFLLQQSTPEPQTWLLSLAGLAAVGLLARRRAGSA